ncbi:helix-turn-helix domain-containing protein [Vannielia litorea]|uniref:helix-turn-helix domain-containing protein n=1 Tax=Vannielia litorea TaxID=1217970 RepID=UPI001BCB5047|nr:helix-turn-helix transcriptional regulator [Vannielia litorea]MBS8228735.1 helix-turn-helix domain-containing protein [Vannielia litorea]
MAKNVLTGSRIRARRADLGLKQSELAERVGISPSYLNLIEHNRRRIGGKLLVNLARALDTEPVTLSEGAETALVDALREAAVEGPRASAVAQPAMTADEMERVEEFAGRFPGWAALLAELHARVRDAERSVEALSDRLSHDPHLSASLHEMLSSVTAIRSTAAILADTPDLDRDWLNRFHRNINDDSARLAESAEGLVRYLDDGGGADKGAGTPQEEVEAWLAAQGFHLAGLEGEQAEEAAPMLETARGRGHLRSDAAQSMARAQMERYRADAEVMPLEAFAEAAEAAGYDPGRLAADAGLPVEAVLRRLASLPREGLPGEIGLVTCDGSGTLTFRKPVSGFPMPRFGAACALWPLYAALTRPTLPVRAVVEMAGRSPRRFTAFAICRPVGDTAFGRPQVLAANMLLLDEGYGGAREAREVLELGTSCRICPREACPARREPSIIGRQR